MKKVRNHRMLYFSHFT